MAPDPESHADRDLAPGTPSAAAPPSSDGPPASAAPRLIFLAVAALVIMVGFAGFDRWFYEHVSCVWNTEHNPVDRDFYGRTKPFWVAVRYSLGVLYGPLVAAVVLLILEPRRWPALTRALLVLAATALVANVLQGTIGRLRPNQADSHLAFVPPLSALLSKQRVSFPSGEAATAFAFATVAGEMFPRARPVLYVLATLAAGARLVNGAHYVSDVVAGAILGTFLSRFLWRWSEKLASGAAPRGAGRRPSGAGGE